MTKNKLLLGEDLDFMAKLILRANPPVVRREEYFWPTDSDRELALELAQALGFKDERLLLWGLFKEMGLELARQANGELPRAIPLRLSRLIRQGLKASASLRTKHSIE